MIYPQTVTYALEALCYLARMSPNEIVKAREISSACDVPEHFLGKILTQLVRKKLLSSQKGPTGGVSLIADPREITIYNVLQALDALDTLEDRCMLGLSDCSEEGSCPFHDQWGKFKASIQATAKKTTLAKLARQ